MIVMFIVVPLIGPEEKMGSEQGGKIIHRICEGFSFLFLGEKI